MNNLASRIIGIICMLGVVVAVGWLIITPIKATHEEQLITEAREKYERQVSMREKQQATIEKDRAEIAAILQEKTERDAEIESLKAQKIQLAAEIDQLADRKQALIDEMNERAKKNREAYLGRKFESFDPGNGKIYRDVEVASVSGEGIQLRNELGLRTVRAEDMSENFQLRFRFGLVPGDKPMPAKDPESEE